ncbi:hypothetical protein [Trinickia sp.]|uniref:hypothetical protein n=1 Tax=Trinickia sp. TaxID=2571163 RepID=UPI003F7DC675
MSEIQERGLRDAFGWLFATRPGAFALGFILLILSVLLGVTVAIAIDETFSVNEDSLCVLLLGFGLCVPLVCVLTLMADSRCAHRVRWLLSGWASAMVGIPLALIIICLTVADGLPHG